ncbi:recombinase family protein [Ferroacidibacillus organovorans]|uniref:Recombinase family protein n=1 Tax=Ferroacidibacillus organovorans TaxID=1765683 RepID=A0A101XTE0_9BACL|nr:recombinase family protein [Ferroacidibacillus organovorans]KUO97124.1 hypothetical protein ATW55_12510 [Ferroacidibacillus organovorans]
MSESYPFSRVINYLRRSRQDVERERRTGEDTLSEQKLLMARVLEKYDVRYDQVEEIGSGDKIETRPVFRDVLFQLEKGVYDAIAVKELSRLGRGSYTDMGRIYDLLRNLRLYVITPWRIYDPLNSSDARHIRFELFLSREEFETTRERLMGARYNYALQGKWMAGSTPYGYRVDPVSQKLIVHEEEAEVVRYIFALAHGGVGQPPLSAYGIAKRLNELGVATPRRLRTWHPAVIDRMLRKAIYRGDLTFHVTKRVGGKRVTRPREEWIIVPGAHEAIAPTDGDAVTRAADEEKSARAAQRRGGNEADVPKMVVETGSLEVDASERMGDRPLWRRNELTDDERDALSGLLLCGRCGGRMQRRVSKRHYTCRDGARRMYSSVMLRCKTRGCLSLPYADVEAKVVEAISMLPLGDLRVALSRVRCLPFNDGPHAPHDTQRDALLERQMRHLEARRARIYASYEEGVYSAEEFLRRRATIDEEIAGLAARMDNNNSDTNALRENGADGRSVSLRADGGVGKNQAEAWIEGGAWEDVYRFLPVAFRREMLCTLFSEMRLIPNARTARMQTAKLRLVVRADVE